MDILSGFFAILDATLRVSTPLILAAMAGLFSERSGIVDISLEGKMLAAAFGAGAVAAVTGSAWLALGTGILVGVALGLVHGFACITHRGNQVVSGLAINILASGLTVVLGIAWFSQGGQNTIADIRIPFHANRLTFCRISGSCDSGGGAAL